MKCERLTGGYEKEGGGEGGNWYLLPSVQGEEGGKVELNTFFIHSPPL